MVVGSPLVLNLIPGGVMPVMMINETDKGYKKEFLIYNGAVPYNLPANVSATIRGTKRDGYGVTEAAEVTSGSNLVRITVTEQMTAVPGPNIFELVFVDTSNLKASTINFIMMVERSALNANTVISDSDIAYAEQVLDQLQSVAAFKAQLDNADADIAELQDVKVQRYDTVAQMKADTTLKAGMYARTGGYYAVNDEGGALYRISSTAPSTHYETLANGLYAENIYDSEIKPEQFGAYGDGTHDDTTAITKACAIVKPIVFSKTKTYCLSGQITVSNPLVIGNNSTIKLIADITGAIFAISANIDISGFVFNTNGHNVKHFIRTFSTAESVIVRGMKLSDFHDTNGSVESYFIMINGAVNVDVHDIIIKNCTKRGNGTTGDAGGALKGVYVVNPSGNVLISNVFAEGIHNVNSSGSIILEDTDVVHVSTNKADANIKISNVYGKDYGKRLIKTQCLSPVSIDGVTAVADKFDNVTAVGIGDDGSGADSLGFMRNCYFKNSFEPTTTSQTNFCFSTSQTVFIEDCYFESTRSFAILNTGSLTISNSVIKGFGIRVLGAKTTVVRDVDFEGAIFIYENSAAEIQNHTEIKNCDIKYVETPNVYGVKCIYMNIRNGDGIVEKCRLNNAKISQHYGECVYKHIKMTDVTYTTSNFALTLNSSAIAHVDDFSVQKQSEQSTIPKFIDIPSGTSISLKNVVMDGFSRLIGGAGQVKIEGGCDITKLIYDQLTAGNVINVPDWYASPPTVTTMVDGILYLNSTDGKLYKSQRPSWIAVN